MATIFGDYRQCEHGYEHPSGPHACDDCLHTPLGSTEPVVFGASARMTYSLRQKDLDWYSSPILDEMETTKHFAAVLDEKTLGVASLALVDLSMEESLDTALIYGVCFADEDYNSGVQRILLHEVYKVAVDLQLKTLWLRIPEDQMNFWIPLGFYPNPLGYSSGPGIVLSKRPAR